MKIALYYPWLYLKSGAERSIAKLVEHSRHEWTLFTGRYEPESTFAELKSCRVESSEDLSVDRSVWATARNSWRVMRRKLPLEGFDAQVVVCEGLGDLVLFRNSALPSVNLCLTPLRIAFDEAYQQRHAEGRGPLSRLAVRIGTALFRVADRRAWRRYDKIFCISEEVRRRAIRGGLPRAEEAELLHVGLGVAPEIAGESFEPYFLIPGRIMWTKNIELGISAFLKFREQDPAFERFRLVVAGFVDAKSESYLADLKRLAGDAPVEFRQDPSDAELKALYRSCYSVLFTPFNEDWGMVPLEGMAFGKPAIAVNRGGPKESIEHGACGFTEEPAPEAFAARMAELARDPAKTRAMGEAGRQAVKRYSWTNFADRIDSELDRLCLTESDVRSAEAPRPERALAAAAAAGRRGPSGAREHRERGESTGA